ncbi:IS3 family transposase [Paenibacillus phoenicis]
MGIFLYTCTNIQDGGLSIEINRYIHYYNNYRYQWERKKMTPV